MKKIICLVCAVLLSIACIGSMVVSADEITVEEKRDYLTRVFPEEYVSILSDEMVDIYYNQSMNYDIEFLGTDTVYLNENTDDEVKIEPYGELKKEDMLLSVSRSYSCKKGTKEIESVSIFIHYFWYDIPIWKKTDAVTVNWDSSVFTYKSDSFYSQSYSEKVINGQMYRTYNETRQPTQLEQGGLGYDVKLSRAEIYTPELLYGNAQFSLLPAKAPMYNEAGNSTSINVQYRHNRNPFVGSIGFSIHGVNIGFNLEAMTDTATSSVNVSYKY